MSSLEAPKSADLTQDDFLGGRVSLFQPKVGYRAGVDPVLLAASVEAAPGQTLLDLGCGVGAAALCVGRRVPGLRLTGLEVQEDYAALARCNGVENALDFEVLTGDLAQMPAALKARQFDHVIANPPYFDRSASTPSEDAGKERAMGEVTALSAWVAQAAKRAAPRGTVTFIHRIERLPELLSAFGDRLGSLEVLPLAPRETKRARMVLVRGRKGGRAGFRLHAPWVLHEGPAHDGDRENHTRATVSVLRDGASLPFS
ncbi:MAG: methyltransferase [Pseudomonadota bacterium]